MAPGAERVHRQNLALPCLGQRSWASHFTYRSLTLRLCGRGIKSVLPCPAAGQIKWDNCVAAPGKVAECGVSGMEGEGKSWPLLPEHVGRPWPCAKSF